MASSWNIGPSNWDHWILSSVTFASTLTRNYSHFTVDRHDAVDAKLSGRPDFSVLVYPVITFVNPAITLWIDLKALFRR